MCFLPLWSPCVPPKWWTICWGTKYLFLLHKAHLILTSAFSWWEFNLQLKQCSRHRRMSECHTLSSPFVVAVQLLSHVQLFANHGLQHARLPCPSLISWSLLKLMSVESVMPSNHLILSRPLLLLPSVFPSITVFSNKSAFYIRWPKYWSFPNRRERFVCAVKQSSFWADSHIMCPIHWYEHDPGLKSLSSGHCLMSVGKALTYLCTEAPTSQEPRWPGVQQHPCWEFQW